MKIKCIFFLLFISVAIAEGQPVSVSGYVKDNISGEAIIAATLTDSLFTVTSVTNNFGYFSLILPAHETKKIIITSLGYQQQEIFIIAANDTIVNVYLSPTGIVLNEVVIDDYKNTKLSEPSMSITSLTTKEIKQLPVFLGETDPLKALQFTPGVQGGQEGSSALYVRGGTPDQNLILIDDVPIYYADHAGGFFSILDVNAINSIKLIKGGFPARYGGRLSSVLDIRLNDGNASGMEGTAEVGIISTKLYLGGPIDTNTTFQVSARKSLSDLFSKAITSLQTNNQISSGYGIYDLNGKIAHTINEKNKIFFSVYSGRDNLSIRLNDLGSPSQFTETYTINSSNSLAWGSDLVVVRWNHIFNDGTFSNLNIGFTNFIYDADFSIDYTDYATNENAGNYTYNLTSQIQDIVIKYTAEKKITEKYLLSVGFAGTQHYFTPSKRNYHQQGYLFEPTDSVIGGEIIPSTDIAFFVENELQITEHLSSNFGLHHSSYFVDDTTFLSLQPRIILNYRLLGNNALKASFSSMTQNLHLLKSAGTGIPVDLWLPATKKIILEQAWQAALGYVHFFNDKYELNTEIYFKHYKNLIDFKEGVSFFSGSADWQEKVYTGGEGDSYGGEIFLKKTEGKHTGWLSYALAKSTGHFSQIDGNKTYPLAYDRRHQFNIVYNLALTQHISLSSVFVFSSGYPVTLASNKYDTYTFSLGNQYGGNYNPVIGFQDAYIYEGRNNYTLPAYHRLDVAFSFTKEFANNNSRTWKVGVYNCYNRLNAYYIFFDYDEQGNLGLYKIALFPIIPFFSYTFNFKV